MDKQKLVANFLSDGEPAKSTPEKLAIQKCLQAQYKTFPEAPFRYLRIPMTASKCVQESDINGQHL